MNIARILLMGIVGCILLCLIIYGLIYVTSLKEFPQTYVISDVSLQRIIVDEDTLLSDKRIYLMKTSIKWGKTETHPDIYYGGLPPFPGGSEDSVMRIYIYTEQGRCMNESFTTIPYDHGCGTIDLYGPDTIRSVICNHDISNQELFLLDEGRLHFNNLTSYCLFFLNDKESIPQTIRFVFPDRVIEGDVNNVPKHYTISHLSNNNATLGK